MGFISAIKPIIMSIMPTIIVSGVPRPTVSEIGEDH
jgi:hypothetical protein